MTQRKPPRPCKFACGQQVVMVEEGGAWHAENTDGTLHQCPKRPGYGSINQPSTSPPPKTPDLYDELVKTLENALVNAKKLREQRGIR